MKKLSSSSAVYKREIQKFIIMVSKYNTCLYLGYRCSMSVAEGRHRQIQFALVVALPEELFAHLKTRKINAN